MRFSSVLSSILISNLLFWSPSIQANPCQPPQALPPGFTEETLHEFDSPVVSIHNLPNDYIVVGFGDGRAYLMSNDLDFPAEPFVDYAVVPYELNGNIITRESESGVLNAVESPDFENDGFFYLFHTTNRMGEGGRRLRITRFQKNLETNTVIEDSETLIFDVVDRIQGTDFHTGGGLDFGPDGMIYLSLGDDGDVNAPQNMTNVRGKVLRVDPTDGSAPPDNPFYQEGGNEATNYIYSLGLRNPYRLFFDPEFDNRLMVTDTGQSLWEEINISFPGANHGWVQIEGPIADNPGVIPPENYSDPWWAYPHGIGNISGFAIVTAIKYTGSMFPEHYHNNYLVTEWGYFGSPGKIFHLILDEEGEVANVEILQSSTPFGYADMTVASDGSLLYTMANLVSGYGAIRRISYSEPIAPPEISIEASIEEGTAPLIVQFTSEVSSSSENLLYCWNFNDGSTQSAPNPQKTFQSPGIYNVTLTVEDEFRNRAQATVEVRVKGNITANLSGQLLDASETELSPLPGEIALFQPDGSTSLFPNRTNVITTDEFGNFSLTDSAFELFGGFIVAEFSSENYVSQTLTIPVSNGTVDFDSEVYLSPLAFIGEVRREDGLLVPGNDVYLQIWNDGIVEPYPFPGGIDAQPPLAPTGVNHVTLTNQLGEYYIPIRLEDGEREFSITANNRPNLSGFSVASFNVETPQSGSLVQDFILNEVFGAGDCNDVFPPTLTFNWDDVQEIFDNHCIGCHGVRNPNAGLSLAEGFSFSSLMERPSVISPKLLVDITSAGDAVANSFLVEKVRCTQPAFGSLMPPTGKLTGREINIIGTWARQTKNQPVLGVFEPALYASATEGSSPLRVEFRGGVRTDADQAPFSFNWNFDNGMTSVNQDAPAGLFVVPEGEQEFEVTLFIRNKDGELLGESTELISISAPDPDPENQSPVAIINAPTFIDANTTINLDGSDSFDPDGLIIAWQWDIGNNGEFDITTSSNQVNWTFEEDGIYPVRLTVTDNQNAQSSSVKYLFVGEFDRLFDGFIIH